MADFTLDTSGTIHVPQPGVSHPFGTMWSDLDPFTQGYIEAALRHLAFMSPTSAWRSIRYDRLAPETVAAILKDCRDFTAHVNWTAERKDHEAGRLYWAARQANRLPAFPPLTPYLGDDGKVYLREATQS